MAIIAYIVLALLFVLTAGFIGRERFKSNPLLTGGVAIIAIAGTIGTYFFVMDTIEKYVDARIAAPHDSSVPTDTAPATPDPVAEPPPIKMSADTNRAPGETFRDCPECPEMVVVPAGQFSMGSPPGEEGRAEDEGPQQRISIKQSFAVGKFEVTFGEWRACIDAGGCGGYRPDDHGWGRGRQPVINVTWQDAQAYVSWLKGRTGKSYRLLSEAEWEYAARAGTTTPFSFGDTISSDQANYDGSYVYGGGAKGANRARTVPVDDPAFKPNQFGLFHMHGNVWEWVGDCWNDSYVEAPVDGSAWTAGDCSRRVLRGGSWLQNPSTLRSANRGKFPVAWIRLNYYGFRVARSL